MGGGLFLVMKRKIQFSFAFLHQKAWWKWYQWRKMKWKNGTPLDSFFVFFSGCLGLVSSGIVYEWNEKKNIFGLEKKKKKSEKNFNTPVAITFSKTKRNETEWKNLHLKIEKLKEFYVLSIHSSLSIFPLIWLILIRSSFSYFLLFFSLFSHWLINFQIIHSDHISILAVYFFSSKN